MQTVTIQINDSNALKTIEKLVNSRFITIIDQSEFNTPSLPGKPLSVNEFRNWINDAEQAPTVSLSEAKAQWSAKRKQLQKLTK